MTLTTPKTSSLTKPSTRSSTTSRWPEKTLNDKEKPGDSKRKENKKSARMRKQSANKKKNRKKRIKRGWLRPSAPSEPSSLRNRGGQSLRVVLKRVNLEKKKLVKGGKVPKGAKV